jgi:hypothetical protein
MPLRNASGAYICLLIDMGFDQDPQTWSILQYCDYLIDSPIARFDYQAASPEFRIGDGQCPPANGLNGPNGREFSLRLVLHDWRSRRGRRG